DTVVLTHFHLDHSYNIARFPNARVLGWNHDWKETGTDRFGNIENLTIAPDVRIMKTPGHTPEHLSVVVKNEQGTTVISGDAINEDYMREKKITAFFYDEQL